MFALLRSLSANRHLIRDFVVRDLRARYVGSSMGFFWSVVFSDHQPGGLLVRVPIRARCPMGSHQNGTTVAILMLLGIVVWAAFSESMSRGTNSLVQHGNLIQKVVFPPRSCPPTWCAPRS
ncbi:MAG: hypothetical protein R3E96_14710 [Planctomycetota bacterium]